jgi:hypothetical protein
MLLPGSPRCAITAISESLVQLFPWHFGEIEVDTRVSN